MGRTRHTAEELARIARTRRRLARFLGSAGVGLTLAALLGAVAVTLIRLLALPIPAWAAVVAPIALALIVALLSAALHRPTLIAVASDVDRALGLRDRLSSGLALRRGSAGDPFAQLAVAESDRAAAGARVRRATPISVDGWWWAWPAVLAVALACAIFVPVLDLAGRVERATAEAQQAGERERVAEEIADARSILNDGATAQPAPVADLASSQDLETLEQIEAQLASGRADPDDARAAAAGALTEAADRLERRADAEARRADAARDRLSQAARSGPVDSDLARALAAGDLEAAERSLAASQRALRSPEPAERERAAEDLRRLADALDRSVSQPTSTPEPAAAEESLRALGVDDAAIDSLRESTDQDAVRDALEDVGVPEDRAADLADQMAHDAARRRADEEARDDARDLADALRDTADQSGPPSPADSANPTPPDLNGEKPAASGAAPEPSQPTPPPASAPPSTPDARGARPSDQPSERPAGQQPADPSDANRDSAPPRSPPSGDRGPVDPAAPRAPEPGPDSTRRPGDRSTDPDGADQPGATPTTDQPAAPQPSSSTRSGQQQDNQPGQPQDRQSGQQPSQQPGEQPAATPEPGAGRSPASADPPDPTGDTQPNGAAPTKGSPSAPPAPREMPAGAPQSTTGQPGEPDQPRPNAKPEPSAPATGPTEGTPGSNTEAEPGVGRGANTGADGADLPEPTPEGVERVRQLLREMRQRDREAARNLQRAAEARERARQIYEKMSPEQRERLERWARAIARQDSAAAPPPAPDAFETETLDLRTRDGSADADRVIARWFDPNSPGGGAGASTRPIEDRLREAARGAERAVEEQSVHRRYSEIVKRYFEHARNAKPVAPPKPGAAPSES